MGDDEWERDLGFGARGEEEGGGVNPSIQPGWEYELNGYWDDDFTNVLDHLSPEAGGIKGATRGLNRPRRTRFR